MQKVTSLFDHIRQVASLVAKLFMNGAFAIPIFGEGEIVGSQRFETVTVVSYRFSIVTIAPSLISQPQFTTECLRRSNQQRGALSLIHI